MKGLIISIGRRFPSPVVRLLSLVGTFLVVVAAGLVSAPPARAVPPQDVAGGAIRIEPSPQLFTTMCALYAAGFEADIGPVVGNPALARLPGNLKAINGPATQALREFYRAHALSDPTATLSRYVTFALVAGPPPAFAPTLPRDDLPPDALALEGFDQILADFYREAGIETAWHAFAADYDQAAQRLREPLAGIVLLATGYLREIVPAGPRTFTLYPEPLVGGTAQIRNVVDHYAVVFNPGTSPLDEVRHAFLHFLIDPLPIRYRADISVFAPLLPMAARAPRLPVELRSDLSAFFTECLVRAVELRIGGLSAAQLAAQVDAAEADGYVLVRPLMDSLAAFEGAAPALSYYFPDLVGALDVQAEAERLQTVAFAPASNTKNLRADLVARSHAGSDLETELAEGERLIAAQDALGAAAVFQKVLDRVPGQPRALYGLAVASVLQGEGARAQSLFEQVVDAAESVAQPPDPVALAWSHVYLGRIYDLQGRREEAVSEYRAALAVLGAPEGARAAAQRGIERGYQPARTTSPG